MEQVGDHGIWHHVLKEVVKYQLEDTDMSAMIANLKDTLLPENDKTVCWIVLESKHFSLVDGVLHFDNPAYPGRSCVVVPKEFRMALLE